MPKIINSQTLFQLSLAEFKKQISTRFAAEQMLNGFPLLYHAIQQGKIDIVKYLCENLNVDVNAKSTNWGMTPIMGSVRFHNTEITKYLAEERNADLTIVTNNGDSVLTYAASEGQLDLVRYFIEEKNLSFEIKNSQGRDIVYISATFGHLDVIRYLVENKNANINTTDAQKITPLIAAAAAGNLDTVKFLIEKGANLEAVAEDGSTAFTIACQANRLEVVKLLVSSGANVEYANKEGGTAFLICAKLGHFDILKFLAEEAHANIHALTLYKTNAMHFAALSKNKEAIKYLATIGLDVNYQNEDNITALILACDEGDFASVRLLLEELKADINIISKEGNTAVLFALRNNHFEIVDYLVNEHGADINVRNIHSNTPLMIAISNNHIEAAKYLISNPKIDLRTKSSEGLNPLMLAIQHNNLEIVEILANHPQIDLEDKDNEGYTAFTIACSLGRMEIVKFLKEKKHVNIESENQEGYTPLMLAAAKGNIEVVKYLVNECEANIEARNIRNESAFFVAAAFGKLDVLNFLMLKGAGINVINSYNISPLLIASDRGHIEVVKYLAENLSLDVESQDIEGYAPLMMASLNGHLDIVKYLVEKMEANIYSYNNKCVTPLHLAAFSGHLETVAYFAKECNFLNINIRDGYGYTPLHSAVKFGHIDIVKFLISQCNADTTLKTNIGESLIDLAQFANNKLLSQYLLSIDTPETQVDNSFGEKYYPTALEEYKTTNVDHKISMLIKIGAKIPEGFLKKILDYQITASLFNHQKLLKNIIVSNIFLKAPEQLSSLSDNNKLTLAASLIYDFEKHPENTHPSLISAFFSTINGLNITDKKLFYSEAFKLVDKFRQYNLLEESDKQMFGILVASKLHYDNTGNYPKKPLSDLCSSRNMLHNISHMMTERSYIAQKDFIEVIKLIPEWARSNKDTYIINKAESFALYKSFESECIKIDLIIQSFDQAKPKKVSNKKQHTKTNQDLVASLTEVISIYQKLKLHGNEESCKGKILEIIESIRPLEGLSETFSKLNSLIILPIAEEASLAAGAADPQIEDLITLPDTNEVGVIGEA